MCGIAGFVGQGSEKALETMASRLRRRGPDDNGFVFERGVGFVHTRLSIIDLTMGGHQPMWNADRSVAITFNGEIYNFRALREKLMRQGVIFKSQSDTEVIVHLYEKEGERFAEHLVGMFAIGLFDFKKSILILARDRMGEKPLYWSLQNETFTFASELGALMESGLVPKELDLSSLDKYLLFDYVPTPHTILKDVYKLEPGTTLVYQNGAIRKFAFWSPSATLLAVSESEALQELDRRLASSVAGQLVSDAPLGVYISGGIDSSTVAWYAAEAAQSQINTFSIAFEDPSFDESKYAREVAAQLRTRHHERTVTSRDALAVIPSIADVFSEPVADASVIPTLLLSEFARREVKVALGGDGADELFAGYPTFQAERLFAAYRLVPSGLRRVARKAADLFPADEKNLSLSYSLKKFLSSDRMEREYRHSEWLGSFLADDRTKLAMGGLREVVANGAVFEDVERYLREYMQPDEMNRLLYVYARTYLMDQVLVKVDRASMHHSLEVRAPFLDQHVVEYAFSLPYNLKCSDFETKYLLKKLMRGRLPDTILDRKKKGFGVPLAHWLKHDLREMSAELLSKKRLDALGLFDAERVLELKEAHMAGKADHRKQLWNLMVFMMWHERWLA